MKTKYYCDCKKDKAWVEIDSKSTALFCEIKGITDCYDVNMCKGNVICNKCKQTFYVDKDFKGNF